MDRLANYEVEKELLIGVKHLYFIPGKVEHSP